jgi:hypothetical protein
MGHCGESVTLSSSATKRQPRRHEEIAEEHGECFEDVLRGSSVTSVAGRERQRRGGGHARLRGERPEAVAEVVQRLQGRTRL